jgi:hypothetical protein
VREAVSIGQRKGVIGGRTQHWDAARERGWCQPNWDAEEIVLTMMVGQGGWVFRGDMGTGKSGQGPGGVGGRRDGDCLGACVRAGPGPISSRAGEEMAGKGTGDAEERSVREGGRRFGGLAERCESLR